nr:hypothetical protein [uncultured Aminipila sp.]
MNKVIRKLEALALVMCIMSICFSGCSLANPALQNIKNGDQLIGVFVTFEEDLKDYIMQDGDTLYYEEKKLVRADGSVKKLTDEEIKRFDKGSTIEGIKQKDGIYNFQKIKGYCVLYTRRTVEENGKTDSYMETHCSQDVYDVKISTAVNEFSENNKSRSEINNEVEATIGVNAKANTRVRLNKIYQRNDGSVYTNIPSSDILCINSVSDPSSGLGNSGISISEGYEDYLTGTGISAQSKKQTKTFKINIEQMDFLQSAEVRQMDKNHQLIKVSDINFSQKNQSLKLEENTDYVIIEEQFKDVKENTYSKRTVYDCTRIGETDDDGYEYSQSHTFKKLDENGKLLLFNLNFER